MVERVTIGDLTPNDDPDRGRRSFSLADALDAEHMAPRVWEYDEGGTSNRHYQREQEELYCVLDGRFELDIEAETLTLEPGEYALVEPSETRQLSAVTDGRILIVGAPNVPGDGVPVNESDDGVPESE